MEQTDIDQDIAKLKCAILAKVYKAENLADCRILMEMLANNLKARLDEYVDAHLLRPSDAIKHLQSVYTVLHDQCSSIFKSPRFNN